MSAPAADLDTGIATVNSSSLAFTTASCPAGIAVLTGRALRHPSPPAPSATGTPGLMLSLDALCSDTADHTSRLTYSPLLSKASARRIAGSRTWHKIPPTCLRHPDGTCSNSSVPCRNHATYLLQVGEPYSERCRELTLLSGLSLLRSRWVVGGVTTGYLHGPRLVCMDVPEPEARLPLAGEASMRTFISCWRHL